jgi:hypothetical protein
MYYSQCEKLIGKEHFDNIFPELLVLLPDIDKQQELLATYKDVQGQTSKSGHVIKISGKIYCQNVLFLLIFHTDCSIP